MRMITKDEAEELLRGWETSSVHVAFRISLGNQLMTQFWGTLEQRTAGMHCHFANGVINIVILSGFNEFTVLKDKSMVALRMKPSLDSHSAMEVTIVAAETRDLDLEKLPIHSDMIQ